MPPQQHNQPNPPQSGPQPSFAPQAPHYGFGTAPISSVPQRNESGQYEVVPPPTPTSAGISNGHNPYEFIVNPNKPSRKRSFGKPTSKLQFGLIIGGAVALLIIAAVVMSSLKPKGSTPGLIEIAERQQEITRVATAATQTATGQDAKNFVATTYLVALSDQAQILGILKSHGIKLGTKQLATYQSTETDTLLANAATANNYDTAVVQSLSDQLQTYENLLQKTYKQTSNPTSQKMLQSCFTNADKLLTQAKGLSK